MLGHVCVGAIALRLPLSLLFLTMADMFLKGRPTKQNGPRRVSGEICASEPRAQKLPMSRETLIN